MGSNHAEVVRQLVAPGFDALRGRMQEVFSWIWDSNCTGSGVALAFLRSIGRPIVPHAIEALEGTDHMVRLATVRYLVADWPSDWIAEVVPYVEVEGDLADEDNVVFELGAMEFLAERRLGDAARMRRRIALIRERWPTYAVEADDVERLLDAPADA